MQKKRILRVVAACLLLGMLCVACKQKDPQAPPAQTNGIHATPFAQAGAEGTSENGAGQAASFASLAPTVTMPFEELVGDKDDASTAVIRAQLMLAALPQERPDLPEGGIPNTDNWRIEGYLNEYPSSAYNELRTYVFAGAALDLSLQGGGLCAIIGTLQCHRCCIKMVASVLQCAWRRFHKQRRSA